jgi:hypothetical protein
MLYCIKVPIKLGLIFMAPQFYQEVSADKL